MDDQRFERLYDRHAKRVLAWCRFALGSPQDAEDVAAETFTRLLAHGDRIADEAVPAWLFTVSRRLCADHGRRLSRVRPTAQLPEDAAVQEPPDPAWTDPRLREAVRALTPLQRQVLYLRVVEDRSFGEVARLCKRSAPAVRMTHHRAIRALEARLRGSEGETDARTENIEATG